MKPPCSPIMFPMKRGIGRTRRCRAELGTGRLHLQNRQVVAAPRLDGSTPSPLRDAEFGSTAGFLRGVVGAAIERRVSHSRGREVRSVVHVNHDATNLCQPLDIDLAVAGGARAFLSWSGA